MYRKVFCKIIYQFTICIIEKKFVIVNSQKKVSDPFFCLHVFLWENHVFLRLDKKFTTTFSTKIIILAERLFY